MLAIALIILGIITRLLPHVPNFTPVVAIALFSGFYLSRRYAVWVPLSLMIITDLFLGLHDLVLFTWGSFILITIIGITEKRKKSVLTVGVSSLASAILFFAVSNFGVWLAGWYGHSFQGLINCYVAAIPFFRTMLLSTLAYTVVLFGSYELIARWVKHTRFAAVLLTN